MKLPQKTKPKTTVRSRIPLPGVQPKETEAGSRSDAGAPVLFTAAKRRDEPKCPSVDGGIKKM